MRRSFAFLVAGLLAFGTSAAFAQMVTFQVNMKVKAAAGLFNPTTDVVTVRGSFNDWGNSTNNPDTLADGNNDSIYVKTIALAPSQTYFYKFWTSSATIGNGGYETMADNRSATIDLADTTLPVVFFSDDGPPVGVTFQVNMKITMLEGTFVPGADAVTVRGSFNDWGNSTNNPDTLHDSDLDSIYTGEFQLPSGKTIDYKFWKTLRGGIDYEGSIANRQHVIPLETPTVIPPVYFDGDSVYTPPPPSPTFLTITPETLLAKDPIKGKLLKAVKRAKPGKPIVYPNWANLRDELIAQGGFAPGTSESDSAGGLRIGMSFMELRNPGVPGNPNWKPIKDSAKVHGWIRVGKYNFKKSVGASPTAIPKTLENKTFRHTGPARGLDSTGNPGDSGRKLFVKEQKKLDPKKTSNRLFAELLALKFNIAASQLGKVPAGLGELIFDRDGNLMDELSVREISAETDTMMTRWAEYTQDQYDSAYSAIYDINRAFVGPLDTVSFMAGNVLVLDGSVELSSVPFLRLPSPFHPVLRAPTSTETEPEEDFEDEEFEDVAGTPAAARVYANYPNPFNPSTTIAFRLLEDSRVTVRVFDMLGRSVATVVAGEEMEEGYQTVDFDAGGLASGVYLYQLEVEGLGEMMLRTVQTGKMVLMK